MVQVSGSSSQPLVSPLRQTAAQPLKDVQLQSGPVHLVAQAPQVRFEQPAAGLASQSLSFVDPAQALGDFKQALQTQASLQALPVSTRAELDLGLQALQQASESGNVAQQHSALAKIQSSLQRAGLFQGQVRQSLEALTVQVVQQGAAAQSQHLEPVSYANRLIGFDGEPSSVRDDADAFVMRLRQQEKMPENLTRDTLLLMSLRDELLRRQLELARGMVSRAPEHQNPSAGYIEQELPLVAQTLQMVDMALADTRQLPPQLLGDLQSTVAAISQARPGEALQALKAPQFNLPGLPDSPSLPSAPQLPSPLSLPAQPQLPAEINIIASQLANQAAQPVPDFAGGFEQILQDYTEVMDKVQGSLPRLWFPITLPIPLAYSDGKTSFIMPPGTQLSQNRQTGEYTAQMPGFLMLHDGTQVVSKNMSLHLGQNLDGLQMESLNIQSGNTQTQLQGVNASISRSQQSATIAAESVRIDSESGTFLLQNAQVITNPEGFQASFDSLQLPEGQTMGQTQLSQTIQGDQSMFNASTQDLNWTQGSQQILAQELQLLLVQGPAGQELLMQGSGLQIREGQSQILADHGSLNIQNLADGSGLISLTGENIHWSQGSQQVQAPGQSSLELTRHAEGYVESLNIQTDQLNYSDGERLGSVTQGSLNLNFGPQGQLQQAGFNAAQVNWQDGNQTLNVSQSQFNLNYDPEGNFNLNGQIGQLDYAQGNESLQVLNGHLNLQSQGEHLSSLQAGADKVDWQQGTQHLVAENAQLNLHAHSNGQLSQAELLTGALSYQNAAESLHINGSQTQLNFGENGNLQNGSMALGDLSYVGSLGSLNTQGQTTLQGSFHDNGQLQQLDVFSESFDFANSDLSVQAQNTTVQLQANAQGQLEQIQASNGGLDVTGAWGHLQTQGLSTLSLNYANEQLQNVQASSEQINFANGQEQLQLNGVDLSLNYHEGQLQNATGAIASGALSGDFGAAALTGGQLELTFANEQLSSVQAGAEHLNLTNHQGQLDLHGSQLHASFGADGALSNLNFSGDQVQYQGLQDPLNFGLQNFELQVHALETGGHNLHFNGQNLNLESQGQALQLESIRQFELQTRPDGSLDFANLHLDGNNTFSNGSLNAAVQNFQGHYQQEGNLLQLRFDSGQLQTENLSLDVIGGQLQHNDQQLSLHVDSAQVIAQLEQELNVKVENLDLILDKNAAGQLQSADLLVGSLDAQVQGLNAMIRTQNGDQVRLHLGLSEDGTFLREAFLQIPTGGEIKLQQDDLSLSLGGGQKLSFTQDGQGFYTFRGEGLDVNLATQDAKVSIQGGTAQVSLDTQRGDLIIDEITGVGIRAEVGGQNIEVDIAQMDGFLVRATGISGLAQGAALHLVPTSDASRMTAEIRTTYNGIPISVKVDDVHELKAMATLQPNRAHVYFGDPSGQGKVELNAGPIKASGSAIEYVVQYNQYDPMRMMTTLSRALSSDGYEVMPGVQIEADGVLRLQTPFKNGPHAGLTLLFPRPAMSHGNAHNLYQPQQMQSEAGDGAMGGIVELGWKGTNREGTQYTGAVHAGLVPGSYLGIHQLQGKTSVAGITLPSNIEIPTTAIAGLTFRRHGDKDEVAHGQESRTDFMLGGYVNPAGLANTPLIHEPNAYGVYTGVEWRKNNMSVGFSSTVDLSQSKPQVGGMLRFGVNF